MPGTGAAPSETTTIENRRSSSMRCFTRRATSSMSNGCSGSKITSAAPAMPASSPIQPAVRPMTSHTMTR